MLDGYFRLHSKTTGYNRINTGIMLYNWLLTLLTVFFGKVV